MRLRFKKMGKPVGNIDYIMNYSKNFSSTATLSVIDGVGIFGGQYRLPRLDFYLRRSTTQHRAMDGKVVIVIFFDLSNAS